MEKHFDNQQEQNNNKLMTEVASGDEFTDDEKHTARYYIEYRWIPQIVAAVNNNEADHCILVDIDFWKNTMSEYPKLTPFDWDDLKFDVIKADETHIVVVYQFPEPIQIPEAAYGAVSIDTETSKAEYYTLEMSFGGWVLGSMDTEQHSNFGLLKNATVQKFIDWVMDKPINNDPHIQQEEDDEEI